MPRVSTAVALFSAFILAIGAPAIAQTPGWSFQGQGESIPGLQGFSVVLVQGDVQRTPAATSDVPPAAAKALADLKEFLPYKHYQFLDTQWTTGSGHVAGRLRGPEGREYDLEFVTDRGVGSDAPVKVARFILRDASISTQGWYQGNALAGHVSPYTPAHPINAQVGARPVIDTSFSMEVGETVVVGTSRLQGDTALIVLLTAVSHSERPSRGR